MGEFSVHKTYDKGREVEMIPKPTVANYRGKEFGYGIAVCLMVDEGVACCRKSKGGYVDADLLVMVRPDDQRAHDWVIIE